LKLLSTDIFRGLGASKFTLSPIALDFFVRLVHNASVYDGLGVGALVKAASAADKRD
jgi:hypothetical protein